MKSNNIVNETIKLLQESRLTEVTKETLDNSKKIILITRDPDKNIEKLLDCIKSYSSAGHSFPVIVDPKDNEMKQEFYIDGDGADSILEITIEQPK